MMGLTSREKEIAEILKKEPLISQEDLACRLGITRSSIAVHISNLMKKGIILGKGYVFNEQVSMVVIGESCMEVKVKGEPGQESIDVAYGGFTTDMSETLARFGIDVKLISILGNDDPGVIILDRLQSEEVDVSNVYRDNQKRTCRRVLINNEIGFREGYSLAEYEKVIDARYWIIFNCEWLVVEDQFQELVSIKLPARDEERRPCVCSCRQIDYPEDIPEFLGKYDLVVIGLDDFHKYDYYIEQITAMGAVRTRNWIITDGRSSIVSISDSQVNNFPLLPNQSFNTRENLELFLAGIIYGLSSGYPLRQALRIGTGRAFGR